MLRINLSFWSVLILAAAIFLLNSQSVNAEQIVISPFIEIPGLTIDTPALLPQSPDILTTLNFDTSSLVLSNQPLSPLQNLMAPPIVIESIPAPSPTSSPTPYPYPQTTPAKTHLAISAPTPSPPPIEPSSPILTPLPTSSPISLSSPQGLNADILFNRVNDYRKSLNLPAFEKDDRSCALAASRAPEVGAEIATGNMHQGLRDRNLPYWNTENIITMRTEQAAFNWWINDYIHKKAIEGDYKYSCLACSGYSCAEEFTNFQPK